MMRHSASTAFHKLHSIKSHSTKETMTMQRSTDRQRMYRNDPTARTWFVVGRCGAALAIMALIAVIGLSGHDKVPDSSEIASMRATPRTLAEPGDKRADEDRQRTAT